jgi:hypothetical protein
MDYAVGSDGPSLSNKTHCRNLILVHADHGARGYFIIFDEVSASAGDMVHNYLHPANQANVVEITALQEYTAKIDHYPTVSGTSVDFVFESSPDNPVQWDRIHYQAEFCLTRQAGQSTSFYLVRNGFC